MIKKFFCNGFNFNTINDTKEYIKKFLNKNVIVVNVSSASPTIKIESVTENTIILYYSEKKKKHVSSPLQYDSIFYNDNHASAAALKYDLLYSITM